MTKKIKTALLALTIILASSCTLDLREDPNAVQIEQALPSLLLNSIQRSLPALFNGANGSGAQMTRQLNGGGQLYLNATTPEGFNGLWSTAYADILMDIDALLKIADANGFARHAGMARVIQAYTIVLLVDYFGNVPFSEAFGGASNFNPKADEGVDLYTLALNILDKAKEDLRTAPTTALVPGYLNPVAPAIQDQFYSNDYNKWVRLANTLKLKIHLNLRLTQPAASTTAINALINEAPLPAGTGGFITTADQNFIWRYGTSLSDPAARHPRFIAQYPGGGGDYQSNWFMWHMFHSYNANNTTTAGVAPGDPRMRFYFNRQVTSNSTSTNELRCLGESRPDHYPSSSGTVITPNALAGIPPMGEDPSHPSRNAASAAWGRTFCTPTNIGYWGRDHVDPQGIPPDGLLRTTYGPYPVGGRFDNNHGQAVAQTQGMRGAGMQPIMMRSFVQFMLAEAALYLGTGTTNARVHYENGIRNSFADVRTWSVAGTLGTSAVAASPNEATTINGFYSATNYDADVNNYVSAALAAYDDRILVNNDEAMNYIAREYWIALFGNGYESYNLYRRTGKPTGMQPVINATPGAFPRSFWYPANFANLNNSVQQKADLTSKVFWDNNTTNLNF
ncbi:MAG: SusD/RagB family nutrient-binding outer membrane lipoprotein [Cyclobacteriaceae bacterium]|nr:MAG: SusD/RagB family nutrient-binding outer membrane lipoprotein [Cyclobacteriaceae bacterium]